MQLPVCEICGKSETQLRYAAYPVIAGFSIKTLNFNSSELLCRKHRTLRWLYASVFTLLTGWFGHGALQVLPSLVSLAKGGNKDRNLNHNLMMRLANQKQLEENLHDEIHCLEDSFCLQDDPYIKKRLLQFYQAHRFEANNSFRRRIDAILYYLGLPVAAWILGIAVGVGTYVPLLCQQLTPASLLFFWVVSAFILFIITTFWSLSVVVCSLEKLLRFARSSNMLINVLLACISPISLFLGILFFYMVLPSRSFIAPFEMIFVTTYLFLLGLALYCANSLVKDVLPGNCRLFLLKAEYRLNQSHP